MQSPCCLPIYSTIKCHCWYQQLGALLFSIKCLLFCWLHIAWPIVGIHMFVFFTDHSLKKLNYSKETLSNLKNSMWLLRRPVTQSEICQESSVHGRDPKILVNQQIFNECYFVQVIPSILFLWFLALSPFQILLQTTLHFLAQLSSTAAVHSALHFPVCQEKVWWGDLGSEM